MKTQFSIWIRHSKQAWIETIDLPFSLSFAITLSFLWIYSKLLLLFIPFLLQLLIFSFIFKLYSQTDLHIWMFPHGDLDHGRLGRGELYFPPSPVSWIFTKTCTHLKEIGYLLLISLLFRCCMMWYFYLWLFVCLNKDCCDLFFFFILFEIF